MKWFFDKLEGFRGLILSALSFVGVWTGFAADTTAEATVLFSNPLDSPAAVGALIPMLVIFVKTVWDRVRKALDSVL